MGAAGCGSSEGPAATAAPSTGAPAPSRSEPAASAVPVSPASSSAPGPTGSSSLAPLAEPIVLATRAGLTVVRPAVDGHTGAIEAGRLSPDRSTIVRTASTGTRTTVSWAAASSGATLASTALDGDLSVRAVSRSGDTVALAPAPRTATAEGRTATDLVVAHRGGGIDRFTVPANVDPEAWSVDGQALFVIEYVPAEAPERYVVRRLDLTTHELGDVFSREKELQSPMTGTALLQALSPDGTHLYTLYTRREPGGTAAFVHALDLDAQLATCIDLPAPFGTKGTSDLAITTSPTGAHVYAIDRAAGLLVDVSTADLAVTRSGALDDPEQQSSAAGSAGTAAAATDGTLLVAGGDHLLPIDLTTLAAGPAMTLTAGGPVLGLTVLGDATIAVARPGGITVVDRAGRTTRSLTVAGLADAVDGPPISTLPFTDES